MLKITTSLLALLFVTLVNGQIQNSEGLYFDKLSTSFIDKAYHTDPSNLFWSLCLGENSELSAEQLSERYKTLIVDSPQRIAFYKRINFYLSGTLNYYTDILSVVYVKNRSGSPVPVLPIVKFKELASYIHSYGQDVVMAENWKTRDILPKDINKFQSLIRKPSDTVYSVVEQVPQFPGGDTALINFLRKHIYYPQLERDNDIQGRVLIRFSVCDDGYVCASNTMRSVSNNLDAEALRVLKMMPHWQPGKVQGKNVATWFILPFAFKLN